MEPTTVKQPLELASGKEYEHHTWGRVMFIAVFPHDGACLVIEREESDDNLIFDTCESSDLTPCNDGESYWPFLGRNCAERERQAREYNEKQRARVKAQREMLERIIKEAESYGVKVESQDANHQHVKLIGQVEVNYWPFSKNKTAHVKGERKGIPDVTPEQACRLAQQIPDNT